MSETSEDVVRPAGATAVDDDAARRELLELSIAAAGVGTFDWDLVRGTLTWDDRLIELFGYDAASFDHTIDAFFARLHPDDTARVGALLQTAVEGGGEFVTRYRVVPPGDDERWVTARGRALKDADGRSVRMLGAAWDDTATVRSDARVAMVLESMSSAFMSLDPEWRITYVNPEAERLLGLHRQQLVGAVIWELFPAARGTDFESSYRRAMATGEHVAFDAYYPAPLDAWFEVRAWRNPDGLGIYFLDVTARKLLQDRSDRAMRRAEMLGRITEDLIAAGDADDAVRRLSQLTVPTLADWCVVTLVEERAHTGNRGGLRHAGSWHVDPAARDLVERYAQARLADRGEDPLATRAMATEQPQVVLTDAARLVEPTVAEPARDLLAQLDPFSVVTIPLRGHRHTLGTITMCTGRARGAFTADALADAQQVAVRAGLVLDNARLHRQQRHLAEGLQRSMLTEPFQPDHLQIAARYVPAAEVARVGGDWYDAFLQPDGSTVLVIGDVVGHDTVAAAAMGQVRTLLRGIAVATGAGPAQILRQVDGAIETLQVGATATAVVARLEQTDDELARGVARLRWSNAGHLPPMVRTQDGAVTVLGELHPQLLLGVVPEARRRESHITLGAGTVVLLCTDGLVERRDQSLEVGLRRLRTALAELGHLELDDLCDELLVRLMPASREDDVALLAVKMHAQSRVRPTEAGPRRIPPNVVDAPDRVDSADEQPPPVVRPG